MDVSSNRKGTVQGTMAIGLCLTVSIASGLMIYDGTTRDRGKREAPFSTATSNGTLTTMVISRHSPDQSQDGKSMPASLDSNAPKRIAIAESAPSKSPRGAVSHQTHTIHIIPTTKAQLNAVFDRAGTFRPSILPAGNPLELTSFTPRLIQRGSAGKGATTSIPTLRRHAFSLGLAVSKEDQRELPVISRSTIVNYLNDHFISVQVQIAKDPVTRELYLLPYPVAGTARFRGASVTQHTEPAVLSSIKNFRCLGLFLRPDEKPTPESLRTLVFVYRYRTTLGADRNDEPITHYNILFVRAKRHGDQLRLHTFITEKNQTVLHYLGAAQRPRSFSECSIQTNVYFNEYSHASLVPVNGIVRSSRLRSRKHFGVDQLEEYARSQQWEGGMWQNVTKILDAMIESPRPTQRTDVRPPKPLSFK